MEEDLTGQICPYPVMRVIQDVDDMKKGQTKEFVVDDPLAIKSIPEELEDYEDIEITIEKIKDGGPWRIKVLR